MDKNKKITDYFTDIYSSEDDIQNTKIWKMSKKIEDQTFKTKVYLLIIEVDYHGGTRPINLGIYSSIEKAKKAWYKYKEDCADYEDWEIREVIMDEEADDCVGSPIDYQKYSFDIE